ncbi:hypothetical protein EHE19_017035 [Ruminiclostridium herbifermentans]|uniref:Uncharacterized protein n=1 Tax=Ruminiclostridium herbifermentans TaxID=2488810 RepID=A0A4U7J4V3_9FIRM|nr:hypothetical protein [Ruminiclostridium herbifermentans]QNU66535.1 hypothetical protein EHE19_017035 [Ruminiclostridium herbifermentans]
MNILEGFSKKDDLVEFICTKCKYTLWVPRFIVEQLEEDNIFNGLKESVPPQPFCQKCDGTMTPVSYTGIRGIKYQFNKD